MPNFRRFLSRRWLLGLFGAVALLFGVLMLHPYPRQALFGPTIRGKPWSEWESQIWRRVHRDEYERTYEFKIRKWMGIERDHRLEPRVSGAEFVPLLVHLASHPDREMRGESVRSLFFISRENEGTFHAIAPLAGNPDPGVREMVMKMMNHFRSESLPVLVVALDDCDEGVRFQAVCQLENLGTDARAAVPSLKRRLSDESASIRMVAARTLGKLDHPE